MMPESEIHTGGLRKQLRALALKSSVDEYWREPVPQLVTLERTVYLPNTDDVELTTQFEARRAPLLNEQPGLATLYTLRAIETQDEISYEELPPTVQGSVAIPRSISGGDEMPYSSEGDDDSAEVDQLVDEDIYLDEARFRLEKAVEYTLNGRAQFVGLQRSVRYYRTDEDGYEEICDVSDSVTGDPRKDDEIGFSIQAWPRANSNTRQTGLSFPNPDLQKLEYRVDRQSLNHDLRFLELVSRYSQSPESIRMAKREQTRAALAILAFTTLNGSAREVQKYI